MTRAGATTTSGRRVPRVDDWATSIAEHERVVTAFLALLGQVPPDAWHHRAAAGRWSPAELTLHVCRAYEFGVEAVRHGAGMQMRVPRPLAWFVRTVLLPRMLAAERFPRGAESPDEVRPDAALAARLSIDELTGRLRETAAAARTALQSLAHERPGARITHAYFGPMPPHTTLRLLSAHTRHHAHGLATRLAAFAAGIPRSDGTHPSAS